MNKDNPPPLLYHNSGQSTCSNWNETDFCSDYNIIRQYDRVLQNKSCMVKFIYDFRTAPQEYKIPSVSSATYLSEF